MIVGFTLFLRSTLLLTQPSPTSFVFIDKPSQYLPSIISLPVSNITLYANTSYADLSEPSHHYRPQLSTTQQRQNARSALPRSLHQPGFLPPIPVSKTNFPYPSFFFNGSGLTFPSLQPGLPARSPTLPYVHFRDYLSYVVVKLS